MGWSEVLCSIPAVISVAGGHPMELVLALRLVQLEEPSSRECATLIPSGLPAGVPFVRRQG
jgi:hypothetical protein